MTTIKRIVLVTGGFDPLHSGHIEYFKAASSYGNILLVGVNSDAWLARKKDRSFMPIDERADIISHLGMVGGVVRFDDEFDADGSGAIDKDELQSLSKQLGHPLTDN